MRATGRIQSSLIIAIAILGLVGSAAATGVFAGPEGAADASAPERVDSGARHEADAIRGDFWAPPGSAAERPPVDLERRSWNPHDNEAAQA